METIAPKIAEQSAYDHYWQDPQWLMGKVREWAPELAEAYDAPLPLTGRLANESGDD